MVHLSKLFFQAGSQRRSMFRLLPGVLHNIREQDWQGDPSQEPELRVLQVTKRVTQHSGWGGTWGHRADQRSKVKYSMQEKARWKMGVMVCLFCVMSKSSVKYSWRKQFAVDAALSYCVKTKNKPPSKLFLKPVFVTLFLSKHSIRAVFLFCLIQMVVGQFTGVYLCFFHDLAYFPHLPTSKLIVAYISLGEEGRWNVSLRSCTTLS